MTVTFCDSGTVKLKAGVNVSTALTDAQYTLMINQAESFINCAIKENDIDYVTQFSSLGSNVKKILEDCASSLSAIYAINYDMSVYTSRQEATTMLNVNYARAMDCIQLLKDKKTTDYIRGL